MGGMPEVDPETGKAKCWSMESQRYEWRNFSDVVEDHMSFDEGVEADIANTTDEERRKFEEAYGLPYRFLDDHDHLFRMYALGNFFHDIAPARIANRNAARLQMFLTHEFMAGEFKDCSMEDCARAFKAMVEERPDLVAMLRGGEK